MEKFNELMCDFLETFLFRTTTYSLISNVVLLFDLKNIEVGEKFRIFPYRLFVEGFGVEVHNFGLLEIDMISLFYELSIILCFETKIFSFIFHDYKDLL